jgi:two-component system, NtrC family, sensor kinase
VVERAPGHAPVSSPPSIRTHLLASIALLFLAAILVAIGAVAVILPLAPSPGAALLPVALIVLADLVILWVFLRALLQRSVLDPVDGIVHHAERIASGDADHRIPAAGSTELDRIVGSVNTLASKLIDEQERLAENVASLEITNRALSETSDELVRAARLASVGTLAAGVAHEIGNPLGALRAYLDVLEGRLERGRPVEELVGDLRHEVSRIDDIVRAILAFADAPVGDAAAGTGARSGADPDAPPTPPAPFSDFRRVVDAVTSDLTRAGHLDNVKFSAGIDPDAPAVRAHPQHLERIVANLLRNAAQAVRGTEPPRSIALSLSRVPAAPRPLVPRREGDPPAASWAHRRRLASLLRAEGGPLPGGGPPEGAVELLLEVTDTGPGIDPEVADRLFDPFYTTREPGEGVGLGLALTARIVAELGGTLEASNRDDGVRGARFRVRLPGVGG